MSPTKNTICIGAMIGDYQSGFRKGKSTIDHVFTLRQIISKHYEYNKNIHLVFVYFRQAYDSIIRNKLWKNLITIGIPNKIVNLIKLCNSNTKCVVRVQGELSNPFEVGKGLRQGDALSPVLFSLALESVLRRMPRRQTMELNENHTLLAYADDIIILGDTKQDTVNSMSDLMKVCKHIGLTINQEKTKYMFMTREARDNEDDSDLEVDGILFQQVHDFKYLGVNINNRNYMHNEIKLRLKAGNGCYFAMSHLFRLKLLSRKNKEKLYTTYFRPVVTYACCTWATIAGDENKLNIFERKVLRKIYGPVYNPDTQVWERRSNEQIQQLYGKGNIVQFIKDTRLEWAGHVWRADNSIVKKVLVNNLNRKRPRDRLKQR